MVAIKKLLFISLMTALLYSCKSASGTSVSCEKFNLEQNIIQKGLYSDIWINKKISEQKFYSLSKSVNRKLWYNEIENPSQTNLTTFWNDYAENNYHASHLDFIKHFKNKKNIELAFQFGPNNDMWAYHIFVVKKINNCYLITRSYFRHARFIEKRYSVLDKPELDRLFSIINEISVLQINKKAFFLDYSAYFRDNRHKKSFYINFEEEHIQKTNSQFQERNIQSKKLIEFIENNIKWKKTYSIDKN